MIGRGEPNWNPGIAKAALPIGIAPENEAVGSAQPGGEARPKALLNGWAELLEALDMKDVTESRNNVKRSKRLFPDDCPITTPRKGAKPVADKAALIAWWNTLADKHREKEHRERDKQATLAAGFDYGKSAKVVPDIQGSERKRRKTKKG